MPIDKNRTDKRKKRKRLLQNAVYFAGALLLFSFFRMAFGSGMLVLAKEKEKPVFQMQEMVEKFPKKKAVMEMIALGKAKGLRYQGDEQPPPAGGSEQKPLETAPYAHSYAAYVSALDHWLPQEAAESFWDIFEDQDVRGGFFYIVYQGLPGESLFPKQLGDKAFRYKATLYTYPSETCLSFSKALFEVGDTQGELSVENRVPGSEYHWSSSSDAVYILPKEDTGSTVTIQGKKTGTARVTCKVRYPYGEERTLTADITVQPKQGGSRYSASELLAEAELRLQAEGCVRIRRDMTRQERRLYGYDANAPKELVEIPQNMEREEAAALLAQMQIYPCYEMQYQGRRGNLYRVALYAGGTEWRNFVLP